VIEDRDLKIFFVAILMAVIFSIASAQLPPEDISDLISEDCQLGPVVDDGPKGAIELDQEKPIEMPHKVQVEEIK
jgi:hypothetical protein